MLATIRDLAIILLAIETIVLIAVFIFIALRILGLVNLISREAKPILDTTSRTANTVSGTTDFIARLAVTPVIRAVTAFAAARKFISVLVGGSRRTHEYREEERP